MCFFDKIGRENKENERSREQDGRSREENVKHRLPAYRDNYHTDYRPDVSWRAWAYYRYCCRWSNSIWSKEAVILYLGFRHKQGGTEVHTWKVIGN
jgi:hypothetical protein